jgi:hypothetical protein
MKYIKYSKNKLSFRELDRELDQLKRTNQLAKQRNEGILKTLQSNLFSNFQKAKISSHSNSLLTREKNRYSDYLAYQVPNLKNEFKVQMKSKQNELYTVKTLLETQIQRNLELGEIEQEFFNNMNKANFNLNEQIKSLTEMNNQIEQDRKTLLIKQTQTDNLNKEHFFNLIQTNLKKETDLNNLLQTQLKQQLVDKTYVNQILEEERNKMKKENEELFKKLAESKTNFNENMTHKKDAVKEQEIKNIDQIKSISPKIEENTQKKVEETKKINEKNLNIIDKIRLERKMKNSKENMKTTNEKDIEKAEMFEEVEQRNENKINHKEVNRDVQLKEEVLKTDKNAEKIQKDDKIEIKEENKMIEDHSNKNRQEKEMTNIKVEEEKPTKEIESENNKVKSGNEVAQKRPELKKKNTLSQLIEDKPVLEKVPTVYKTKTVKRIITYLEQFSKSKKPGNFIYSTKIINQVSQKIVKDSFYEIVSNDQFDFSTSDPELLISTIGEILYLSGKPNLIINNNDFDEIDFETYLERDVKELYVILIFI